MKELTISEIQITPIKPQKSLVGFASCILNGQLYIGCIAIHCDLLNQSFRCVYPTKKFKDGKEIPLYHPITKEAGEAIQKAIVGEWEYLINTVYP
jgi:DNA-binding cell septation regulator SpoVG